MMRIGYIVSAFVITFLIMYSYTGNISFANSCCGIKQASVSDESVDTCKVCGKAIDSMGKPVEVEEDGKSIRLCCQGCATAYREHPDKYSHEKRQESYREKYQRKEPQKKQRGESYY
ncbi:MAG: hypothetical protein MRK02_16130 [Candidatus Scalindua sp.]|nr:hypothetical protein [Candidatus Scalindua sp.]